LHPRAIAQGFITPPVLLLQAGVKFVPHNTSAFARPQMLQSHFTASGKVSTVGPLFFVFSVCLNVFASILK